MRSSVYAALSLLSFAALVSASALPNPSPAIVARSPIPSPALEARSPQPSYSKRAPHVKRKQILLSPEEEMSRHLCPFGMSVCPIPSESGVIGTSPTTPTTLLKWIEDGFECADMDNDLTSCGGCGSIDVR